MNGYEPIGNGSIGVAIDVTSGNLMAITGPTWVQIQRERRDGRKWSQAIRGGRRMRSSYADMTKAGDGGYIIPVGLVSEFMR